MATGLQHTTCDKLGPSGLIYLACRRSLAAPHELSFLLRINDLDGLASSINYLTRPCSACHSAGSLIMNIIAWGPQVINYLANANSSAATIVLQEQGIIICGTTDDNRKLQASSARLHR